MTTPQLLSIQVSLPKDYGVEGAADPMDQPWRSAFSKESVQGAVEVLADRLDGDGQADLVHHGGTDKSVLVYAASHYAVWRGEYPQLKLSHGAFGENFTVSVLEESKVCIGDVFVIGNARFQVSQPRIPCWKISRRWRTEGMTERVRDSGRTGFYFRVLQVGRVEAGTDLELLERPYPELTIEVANDLLTGRLEDRVLLAELASCLALSAVWRKTLGERI